MLIDVLAPDLKIVFCGTAAGTTSAARNAYYAGSANKFWRVLFETGLTPRQLKPEEYGSLLDFGLGLTDLVKSKAGMDRVLAKGDFDRAGLEQKIRTYRPMVVCFNGKKAAQEFLQTGAVDFGLQRDPECGGTRLFVAPSTSGAAAGFWDQGLWEALARLV